MSIRLHTSKAGCHTQPAMRAKGPRIGPHCHSAIITTARGWTAHFFYHNWAFFPPSTMVLKNMISSFESFQWLQTFSKRPKCRESLWFASFWDWSIDGTVGSCYGSVSQQCKGGGGKNIHFKLINSGSEKKKSFIYAQVSFAKYNRVTSN